MRSGYDTFHMLHRPYTDSHLAGVLQAFHSGLRQGPHKTGWTFNRSSPGHNILADHTSACCVVRAACLLVFVCRIKADGDDAVRRRVYVVYVTTSFS